MGVYGHVRPAVPPPDDRELILFGGPLDGRITRGIAPPPGYRDFAGALCVWHAVRIASMPLWQGEQFKAAVRLWHLTQE